MHFISISGVAGSGKTTVSDFLKETFTNHNYSINEFSFASPLKDALCLWMGWDRKRLDSDFAYKEGNTLDDGSPDPYCERLGMTRRTIMQKFGTECMRDGMHSDFWVILADLGVYLGKIPPSDIYVLSDCRFSNELKWIKSLNGFQIYITRAECPVGENPEDFIKRQHENVTLTRQTNHISEQDFIKWTDFDLSIVNLIDKNVTQEQNMNLLKDKLKNQLIPKIKSKFNIK